MIADADASRSAPLKPLGFEVVSATSAHSAHPPSELMLKREDGGGWLSNPLSEESPQEILLRLHDGPCSSIHSIAILSHQYMIPMKIEIITASGNPDTFDECSNIRRLGFVTLSDNAQSNYSARELKTVAIGEQNAQFVKLRLHACHPNDLNVHNQVAILGLELIGHSINTTSSASANGVDDLELLQLDNTSETDSDEVNGNADTDTASDSSDSSNAGDGQDEMDGEGRHNDGDKAAAQTLNQRIPPTPRMIADQAKDTDPSTTAMSASASHPTPQHTVTSPPLTLSAKEFMDQRQRTNEEVRRRLDHLNQIKLQWAAVEDFDCAARVKDFLSKTKSAFSKLNDLHSRMRQASEAEDYLHAAKLKNQRDSARIEAMHFLDNAESDIAKICGNYGDEVAAEVTVGEEVAVAASSPSRRSMFAEGQSDVTQLADIDRRNHLPCDTPVHSPGQPHHLVVASSSPTTALVAKDLQYPSPHRNDHGRCDLGPLHYPTSHLDDSASTFAAKTLCHAADNSQGNESDSFSDDTVTTVTGDAPDVREEYDEDNHPLIGVPDYMALPAPEDINDKGGEIAIDTIARIESLVGSYLTRCFFSRNYSLREASLTKVSLMLPEMGQQQQQQQQRISGADYLRTVCILLERAMNDRVIAVFVAALILLDDLLSEFEQSGMSSKEVLSHLSVITPCLVVHLGDNNSKVVDGAETALLSMALSRCIGPAYIAHLLTKRTKEMRAPRAIIARMRVAQTLMYEFGPDHGIPVEELMECFSEHAVAKDADVREAAKEVAITASKIIGRNIERYLHGMSERHRRAVMNAAAAAAATQAATDRGMSSRPGAEPEEDRPIPSSKDSAGLRLNDDAHQNQHPPPRRGRGRGRSRDTTVSPRLAGCLLWASCCSCNFHFSPLVFTAASLRS